MRNATTYSFPVRYKVIKGASIERLIYQQDPTLLEPFIEAGWDLVREGVKAITGDCGFMILFQERLAKKFPVPIFMSSLLQMFKAKKTAKKVHIKKPNME